MGREDTISIADWVDDTFGTKTTPIRAAVRANQEMSELMTALLDGTSESKAREECADVAIVLCMVCRRLGGDLWHEIERKMDINRGRTWAMDGSGCGYHVKAESTP